MLVTADNQIVNHSCRVLAKGGARFGEYLKARRKALVRILTDDCEIALGILLRDDERYQCRVGLCTNGTKGHWQVVAIPWSRIQHYEIRG